MRQDKTKEIFGLGKVPDSAIIKQQSVDIGILKSTIDELEYDLKEAKKRINEDSNVDKFKNTITGLNKRVEALTKQVAAKDRSYTELSERLNTVTRKNVVMEKQLLQNLKDKIKKEEL